MSKSGSVFAWSFAVVLAAAACGCSTPSRRGAYTTVQPALLKDRNEAKQINDQGILTAESGNFGKAEKLFREALKQDLTYAAAHNNLGLVLLSQKRYYEAAWEFEYAARLDAEAIEPLGNLARLYENIGWRGDAHATYRRMAELEPSNPIALAGIARTRAGGNGALRQGSLNQMHEVGEFASMKSEK